MSSVATSTVAATSVTATLSVDAAINRVNALVEFSVNALQHPGEDPLAALLVIATVGVAALLILVVSWLVVDSARDAGRRRIEVREEQAPAVPRPLWRRCLPLGAVVLIAGAFAVAGWSYGTSDKACASCHVTSAAVASHAEGTHARTRCSACHVGPGVRGAYVAAVGGSRNLVVEFTASYSDAMPYADVSSGSCVTCHEEVTSGTLTARGIRMRHTDVLDVGYECTDCHGTVGHGSAVRRERYPQMAQCIQCHDGSDAPSECDSCHSTDVGTATRTPGDDYVKADIQTDGCRGCHSMDSCIDCHGLELPHSEEFVTGFHARKALLQAQSCMKCHGISDCDQCHKFRELTPQGTPVNPHAESVSGYVAWHRNARGPGVGSCSCHDLNRERFCNYCHGPQPER